jgi:hypothetical protein
MVSMGVKLLPSQTPIYRYAMDCSHNMCKELSSLSLTFLTPSETFAHVPCARPSTTLNSVEVFWILCSRNTVIPVFLFSDSPLRTQSNLHSSCMVSPTQIDFPPDENKSFLSSLLNTLYAEEFDCTLCRNLLAQQRNN